MGRTKKELGQEYTLPAVAQGETYKERLSEAAYYLAGGMTPARVARMCGVPLIEVRREMGTPAFAALAEEASQLMWATQESGLALSVHLAQNLLNEALAEKRDPTDEYVKLAFRVLSNTFWKAITSSVNDSGRLDWAEPLLAQLGRPPSP